MPEQTPKAFSEIQKEVHTLAKEKGWWDPDKLRSVGDTFMLMCSEVHEAYEAYRSGHAFEIFYEKGKPEGVPIELADAVIRIMDFCEAQNIDLEEAIRIKHEFNKTRPYRHGGKLT